MPHAKRKLAVGAAGLIVLAGTGGAYAATQSSSAPARPDPAAEQKAFLDDVAKRLNVTRDKLDDAIKGAAAARIDAAVAAGRLTKEQADEAKKRIESGTGVPLLGGGPHFRGGPGPGGPAGPGERHGGLRLGFGPGKSLDAAAKLLGLSADELRTQLKAGKSLADVAKAKGKSVDELKAAIKSAVTTSLDKAVADKKLTAEQRTRMLAELDAHLDDLVNDTHKGDMRMHRNRRP